MSPVKHLRLKRFLAKYVTYVTWGGYALVLLVVAAVIVLWFVRINLYCNSLGTEKGALKPFEYAVKPTSDTVVLRYLVQTGDEVAKGQPVAEYCDDPAWVAKLRAAVHLKALAEDLQLSGLVLPNGLEAARTRAQAESLEALRASPPLRKAFPALGSGVVLRGAVAEGAIATSADSLMTIHDLDDLRTTIKMVGSNVNECAIGREALVELKNQNHMDKSELIATVSGDRPAGKPELRFTNLGSGAVATKIGEAFKGYTLFIERTSSEIPVPYSFDSIKDVTFRATARGSRRDPSQAPGETAGGTRTDLIAGREFRAKVIGGEPLTELTFTDLPDDAQKIIEDAVMSLDLAWSDGREAFAVDELRNLRCLITINAKSSPDDSTWTKYNKERVIEGRVSNRRFVADIQLVSPPPELKAVVKELLLREPATFLETKVRIVAIQTGIASLLFSQE